MLVVIRQVILAIGGLWNINYMKTVIGIGMRGMILRDVQGLGKKPVNVKIVLMAKRQLTRPIHPPLNAYYAMIPGSI